MKRCPHCAEEIPDKARYCMVCKTKVDHGEIWIVAVLVLLFVAAAWALSGYVTRYQGEKLTKVKNKGSASTTAKKLLISVCHEIDGYLSFYNSNVSEPSLADQRQLKKYLAKFLSLRTSILSSISSFPNPQDQEMAKNLLELMNTIYTHAEILGRTTQQVTQYDHLDQKSRSLAGQTQYFREVENDAELANFLERKTKEVKSEAVATKAELTPLAQELDGLTENIINQITNLHPYFSRHELDQSEIFLGLKESL